LYFLSLLILSLSIGVGYLFMPARIAPYSASAQEAVTVVNAASFASDKILAPGAIAAVFGNFKTTNSMKDSAKTIPLPTSLVGVSVKINGVTAGLGYVQPQITGQFGQINLVIPEELNDGPATIVVTNSDNTTLSGTFTIVRSRPGIFTSNTSGNGAPAAQVYNSGIVSQVGNPDGTPLEISAGTQTQPATLVMYLTALRKTPAQNPNDDNKVAEGVKVSFSGIEVVPDYAGEVQGFVGLDQINVRIPWSLSGFRYISVKVFVSNGQGGFRESNQVTILLGGSLANIVAQPITDGQVVHGDLTFQDNVQQGDNESLYLFDAYVFQTTSANQTIAADLRSNAFDAAVLVYRVEGASLIPIGSDDFTGTFGGPDTPNNALFFTVLPQAGQYIVLVTTATEDPLGIGPYDLFVKGGTVTPAAYSATPINASITTTDVKNSANTYIDAYWFAGQQGDKVVIQMTATGGSPFAPLLVLQRSNGSIVAVDENDALSATARIEFTLPQSGNYVILGTPFEPNIVGPYTFLLQKAAAASASEAVETSVETTNSVREFRRFRTKQSASELASPLTRESRLDAIFRRRFLN